MFFNKLHTSPLTQTQLHPVYKGVVSSDQSGVIEYWTRPPHECKFPQNVNWEYKTDTDLCESARLILPAYVFQLMGRK